MPRKILIVDDEPNIVVPLQFLMEQSGYEVRIAQSGEEAVEAIPNFIPDLILLDIMLPILDGFEVCQRVRENPEWQHTKIILITAMGREDVNIAKGLALGADAYITKPFSNSEVVEKVKELLKLQ
jgi:DNA-binding response OmpR family regulator